jgi:hypothetical protein
MDADPEPLAGEGLAARGPDPRSATGDNRHGA